MRKLFILLITFLAVVTFIRAFDNAEKISIEIAPAVTESSSEIFIN